MDVIIWVIAYLAEENGGLAGFLKDPEFMFESQEAAHDKKQEAFKILYTKGAVSKIEQLKVVPLNELGVKIE